MKSVGIRALKQNASAVVAEVAGGDIVIVTDRGRPVARMVPYQQSRLEAMVEAGQVSLPTRDLRELPPAAPREPGARPLTELLEEMRAEERF